MLRTMLSVLLFIALSSTYCRAKKSGKCRRAQDFTLIIQKSFEAHAKLIQLGIPSKIVSAFYNRALDEITSPDCICDGETLLISRKCVYTTFTGKKSLMVQRLTEVIQLDASAEEHIELFPFYNENIENGSPPATEQFEAAVKMAYEHTQSVVFQYLQDISMPLAPVTFPADVDIVWDPEGEEVCKQYERSKRTVSASVYWSYVIGLALRVRFEANELEKVEQFLDKAAREVFVHLRCQRRDGDELRIPVESIHAYASEARDLIHAYFTQQMKGSYRMMHFKHFDSFQWPQIDDIAKVSRVSIIYLWTMVSELSNFGAYGRAFALFTDGESVTKQTVMESLLKVDLHLYKAAYTASRAPAAPVSPPCFTGYTLVARLVPVIHFHEKCCASSCMTAEGSLLDRAMDIENCCASCNQYYCGSGEMDGDVTIGIGGSGDVYTDPHVVTI